MTIPLKVDNHNFQEGYNINFTPWIEVKKDIAYINWANALTLLKQNFSGFDISFENLTHRTAFTEKHSRQLAKLYLVDLEQKILQTQNKKEQGKLEREYKSLEQQLLYGSSGYTVGARVIDTQTGALGQLIELPVMDYTMGSMYNPSSRDISDSKWRCAVKAIAVTTGIGLRLWSRELIDIRKNDCQHPVYKGLVVLNNKKNDILSLTGILPDFWEEPDFSWNVKQLRELNSKCKKYLSTGGGVDVINSWKTPKQALDWAIQQLGDVEQANNLFKQHCKDHEKLYNVILELKG